MRARVKSVACACVHFGGTLSVSVWSHHSCTSRNKRLQSTAVETRVRRKKRNHPWQKAPPQVPNLTAQRISGHMSNWLKHTLTLKLKKTNDETRSSHSSDSTTPMNCGFEVEPWTSKNKVAKCNGCTVPHPTCSDEVKGQRATFPRGSVRSRPSQWQPMQLPRIAGIEQRCLQSVVV